MVFDCGPDLRQESIRKGWNGANTLIQYYFFDPMDREEDRVWLNSTFFTMSDVVHPVVERIEINSPDRYSVRRDIQ